MSYDACILAVREAAKEKLSKDELDALVADAGRIRKRIEAEGKLDNFNDRLREEVQKHADRIRIAAALQKMQAQQNAIVRDRLTAHVDGLVKAGLSPSKAMLAVFEGSPQGVANARKSVYALKQAYEGRYLFGMLAEISRDRPHVEALVDDPQLGADIVREMYELREGGTPGITKNADAKALAMTFAKFAEMSRTDLNEKGAGIGKLDGWAGPQRHDEAKIAKASEDEWLREIMPLLDVERTFPDATSPEEVADILRDIRRTIVTGQDSSMSAVGKGQRVGPANLGKKLGRSRVLHFKDANSWLDYNAKYGRGGIFQGMITHQQSAASAAAQMDTFGPNPEVMLGSFLEELRQRVRNDPKMAEKRKVAEVNALNLGTGGNSGTSIAAAFLDMQGLIGAPANMKLAKIGQGVRNFTGITSLGGAVVTALPSDTLTAAAAGMFRGGGFWRTATRHIAGLLAGRPKGEQQEISFLLGEGADGLLGHINSPFLAHDGVPGYFHKATTTFFKWNGLEWATDVARSVAARTASAEMGMRAKAAWDKLPGRYQQALSVQGITPEKWGAIRTAAMRQVNGNDYVTPDAMRNLSDEALEPLIAERMAGLTTQDPARRETARQRYLNDMRLELELDVARYFADETSFAVVETDAASRRIASWNGTRSGTIAGETARFIMQFKGFPIAFTQRVLGRALFGGSGATKGERFINNLPHTGALLAGLTAAGYLSIVGKDMLKGQWPPRNPADPKVWLASALQGGALGIYSDFLFGEANRFGGGMLDTLAGPTIGRVADVVDIYHDILQKGVEGEAGSISKGRVLNAILTNTPFLNLYYVKPAVDALFLNSVREWASPGYRRRQERRLWQDYGQQLFLP